MSSVYFKQMCILLLLGGIFYKCQLGQLDVQYIFCCFSPPPTLPMTLFPRNFKAAKAELLRTAKGNPAIQRSLPTIHNPLSIVQKLNTHLFYLAALARKTWAERESQLPLIQILLSVHICLTL